MRTAPKALTLALAAIGCSVILADTKKESAPEFPAPQLAHLDYLVGLWKVEQKHFDPAGAVIATAEGTEEITWILDKHAIQRVYRTKTGSSAFEAIGLLTWNDTDKRFDGAWFDNASSAGPARVFGEWRDAGRSFVFTLEGFDSQGPAVYNVIDRFESDSVRVATTFRVKKTEALKISEVKYTRTAPCPDRMRAVFDN